MIFLQAGDDDCKALKNGVYLGYGLSKGIYFGGFVLGFLATTLSLIFFYKVRVWSVIVHHIL